MRTRWIIGGILLVAALGAAYTGYWFWLARTFEQNLALWIDEQRAMGYRISYSATRPSGYPFAAIIGLNDISVLGPPGKHVWSLTTSALEARISPWSPFDLRFGGSRDQSAYEFQLVSGAEQHNFRVSAALGTVTLALAGNGAVSALEFDALTLEVFDAAQKIAFIHDVHGRVEVLASRSPLAPFASFRASLSVAESRALAGSPLGDRVSHAQLAGHVVGPIPREPILKALNAWSDAGGIVELTEVDGRWGPIVATANGTFALDHQLQPIGAVSAIVRGYDEAVDAGVVGGFMTPAQGAAAKLWLSARAERDESGLKVKLPLTIQDGFVSMGPIELVQVPRIAWE